MPKRIIIVDLCDECIADDIETNATWSETVSIGKLTRVLMLCDEHRQTTIGDLPDKLAKFGVKPESVVQQPAKTKLPKVPAGLPSGSSHGPGEKPMKIPTKAKPTTYDKKAHRSKPNPLACEWCTFVAHNGTGLSAHQRAKHSSELEALNGAA